MFITWHSKVTTNPSEQIALIIINPTVCITLVFLYIATPVTFIPALSLGIFGNSLKWMYPVLVAVFVLFFYAAIIFSDSLYSQLHHNHGVNNIFQIINWIFFSILTSTSLFGVMIGAEIKLIINKAQPKPRNYLHFKQDLLLFFLFKLLLLLILLLLYYRQTG